LRARYDDPSTGSFLSRDPLSGATHEPYSYANENPLNERDGSGLCGEPVGFIGPTVPCVPPRYDSQWRQRALRGKVWTCVGPPLSAEHEDDVTLRWFIIGGDEQTITWHYQLQVANWYDARSGEYYSAERKVKSGMI